jgi:hypothetical protein
MSEELIARLRERGTSENLVIGPKTVRLLDEAADTITALTEQLAAREGQLAEACDVLEGFRALANGELPRHAPGVDVEKSRGQLYTALLNRAFALQ